MVGVILRQFRHASIVILISQSIEPLEIPEILIYEETAFNLKPFALNWKRRF